MSSVLVIGSLRKSRVPANWGKWFNGCYTIIVIAEVQRLQIVDWTRRSEAEDVISRLERWLARQAMVLILE